MGFLKRTLKLGIDIIILPACMVADLVTKEDMHHTEDTIEEIKQAGTDAYNWLKESDS